MSGRAWLHGLCSLLLLAWMAVASAVEVGGDVERIDLSAHLLLLHDADGRLGIADIDALQTAFVPASAQDRLARPAAGSTFWLRIELSNPGKETVTRWLAVGSPQLQSVQLFEQGVLIQQAGSAVAAIDKPVRATVPVFPLHLRPGERRDLTLRVSSETLLRMDAVLWEPQAFRLWSGERQLPVALALGFHLLSGVLSLFVFALLKEWSYFHFGLLQFSSALMLAIREGLLQLHVWPSHLPFPSSLILIVGGVMLCSILMLPLRFFDLKTHFPGLDGWLATLFGLILIVMLIGLVDFPLALHFIIVLMPLVLLSVLLTTVLMWRQGYRPARFMLLAFVLTFLIEGGRHFLALGQLPASFMVSWLIESARQYPAFSWLPLPVAMDFSLPLTQLISTPLILVALTERTRELAMDLAASRQLSQARSAFLTRVSHDLRSPLNVIIGYARMLVRGSERLPVEEGARGIEKSGLRVLGMIDDLLEQASLESGHFQLRPRAVRLPDWLQEVGRAAQLQAAAAGNTVVLEFSGVQHPDVVLDDERVLRVLDNLLGNANRHTDRGRIRFICRSRGLTPASANQVELHFEVVDTGCGIAEQDQCRIFEPFVQLPAGIRGGERRRPGIGMGLPIATELLRLMGSALQLKSLPGVGSTFWFVLRCPLGTSPEDRRPVPDPDPLPEVLSPEVLPPEVLPPEAATPASSATPGPGPAAAAILIVDDDAEARLALADLLQHQGFAVIQAGSGVEAVSLLKAAELRIDAVVTDQMMAQGDGWSVLCHARERRPTIPVLLLSAVDPVRPVGCSPQRHFDAVLRKPAAIAQLLTALDELLQPVPPPQQELQLLLSMLRAGEVSDIEDWVEQMIRLSPRCAPFAREVRQHLLRLDFAAIERQTLSALS